MGVVKLSTAGIRNYSKATDFLVGNVPFSPIPPSAFDLLETTTLSTSASSVTFSGLGAYSDYKHLQIRMIGRSDASVSQASGFLDFNGDTVSTNYKSHFLEGRGNTVLSAATAPIYFVAVNGASETAGDFSVAVTEILDFSNVYKNTTTRTLSGKASSLANRIDLMSGLWMNTNAVTSIRAYLSSGNWIAGSRFSLIGIR